MAAEFVHRRELVKQTIRDIDWQGKRALVRVDFNVPLDDQQQITDDTRITAAVPTIQYLLDHGASVVLMSHLGRPKNKVVDKLRLDPVARRLGEVLGREVRKVNEITDAEAEQAAQSLQPGQVLLLENTRFDAREEANDDTMAQELAKLGDVYVNDAFGAAHRAHASTEGVARHLPAVSGFLMEKELEYIGGAVENPQRPFVAILGGAKIKDKIPVIENLLPKVDKLIIGGGMAYTFYKAQGYEIGQSLLDEASLDFCKRVLGDPQGKLELPVDCVVAKEFSNDAERKTVKISEIPADYQGLDIGPETVARFSQIIQSAKTVVWNGPMGVFEMPNFATGTRAIAEALARATEAGATTIIGGGDSVAAVEQMGLADRMAHISTGGGASLELLEGKELPGVAALNDK
ncbi:MAG: phosphoglycerate kinase [Chloroflexota bacterium]|nr:phosphoglycerate kinase [Chloroflexota bacterium]